MKTKFKKVLVCAVVGASLILNIGSVQAADRAYDRLSMSMTGNRYLYSNNPEKITTTYLPSGTTGKCTLNRVVSAGALYDVEFSHTNMTGTQLTVAVLITNNSGATANITVLNKSSAANGTYDIMGAAVEKEYWSTSKYESKSLANGASEIICSANISSANYSTGIGKVMFKADRSVNCKVVYMRTGTTKVAAGKLPALSAGELSGQTTSECKYDGRTVIYDYNTSKNKSFYLNMDPSTHNYYNNGEFEKPVWFLPNSREYNQGNWGISYNMRLNNCGGKTLYIQPDWDNIKYTSTNSYTIYDPYTTSWKAFTLRRGQFATIKLPNSSSFIFNFVLAGGDSGHEYFTFIKPTSGTSYAVN